MQFLSEPILVKEKKTGSYKNGKGESKNWFGFSYQVSFDNGDVHTVTEFVKESIFNKLKEGKYYNFYGNAYRTKDKDVWYITDCQEAESAS